MGCDSPHPSNSGLSFVDVEVDTPLLQSAPLLQPRDPGAHHRDPHIVALKPGTRVTEQYVLATDTWCLLSSAGLFVPLVRISTPVVERR